MELNQYAKLHPNKGEQVTNGWSLFKIWAPRLFNIQSPGRLIENLLTEAQMIFVV